MTRSEFETAISFIRKALDDLREATIKLFEKAEEQASATTALSGDVRSLSEKVDGAFSPDRAPCNTVKSHLDEHKQKEKTRGARIWQVTSRIIIAAIFALGGFIAAHLHF